MRCLWRRCAIVVCVVLKAHGFGCEPGFGQADLFPVLVCRVLGRIDHLAVGKRVRLAVVVRVRVVLGRIVLLVLDRLGLVPVVVCVSEVGAAREERRNPAHVTKVTAGGWQSRHQTEEVVQSCGPKLQKL